MLCTARCSKAYDSMAHPFHTCQGSSAEDAPGAALPLPLYACLGKCIHLDMSSSATAGLGSTTVGLGSATAGLGSTATPASLRCSTTSPAEAASPPLLTPLLDPLLVLFPCSTTSAVNAPPVDVVTDSAARSPGI